MFDMVLSTPLGLIRLFDSFRKTNASYPLTRTGTSILDTQYKLFLNHFTFIYTSYINLTKYNSVGEFFKQYIIYPTMSNI